MDHIKDTILNSPTLKKLKQRLSQGGNRDELLSLLSESQKSEIHTINFYHGTYTIKLKSSYALYGIKDALRNFHHRVKISIVRLK